MDKIKMGIYGLQYSQTQTGAYALVLEETEGTRRLPIIIGSSEAQAIATSECIRNVGNIHYCKNRVPRIAVSEWHKFCRHFGAFGLSQTSHQMAL